MIPWLLGAGIGPALVGFPVNWTAEVLAGAAQRWFRRFRRTDDLSHLVQAATGSSVELRPTEFAALRRLLEDQQTWTLLGRGTVEDLATRIASCMPARDGHSTVDSRATATVIARGLIEFAVADIDPKLFQQVLLARLQRMETAQASRLDGALLGLHADLIAGIADVMKHLKRVLDQLPPGPAQRGEIVVYLRTLIAWVNTDPWPQDRRFDGPTLTPAAIERKLRVTAAARGVPEKDLDADELAQQCWRLVMLGGPGSGKTWLARRTARRCAEEALQALATGASLDEVELPLYTTCSQLLSANGAIREAAVSGAIDQLGDLGGARISAALRDFFAERNALTVLVIDSLDEAHAPDERLRQADTLPWRIVLTSRPSSWNQQLVMKEGSPSHRVGELQPLQYPDDVEPFIRRWFARRPEWGDDLAAQIARRPDLQNAASVPLILAFYCIVGRAEPLPVFRRDLYVRVLNRLLSGRWRGDDDGKPDTETCLQTLRAWAWSGATSDPISGVGTWADDIPTQRVQLSEADQGALDHVATPVGPADIDTGKTVRRFIHRSIREQLVADHVASLPVDQAVEALLPHVWYDSDWEYSAPAALAMHPQRDQVLRDLLCRAARSDKIPGDLSVIDAMWESRRLLARAAAQSNEADWSPQIAGVIGKARVELARWGRFGDLDRAASWATSNREAIEILLGRLGQAQGWAASELVGEMDRLAPTTEEKRRAREILLQLMTGQTSGSDTAVLAGAVARLDPTTADKRQALKTLLGLLPGQTDGLVGAQLARALVDLDPTTEDKLRAREILLQLMTGQTNGPDIPWLAGAFARLDPTADDNRRAREALVEIWPGMGIIHGQLASGMALLAPTGEDKRRACETLVTLLLTGQIAFWAASEVADALAQLDPTAEDKRQTRGVLLMMLVGESDGSVVGMLAGAVARLDPTAEDKRQAREALLRFIVLDGKIFGPAVKRFVDSLIDLDPTAEDKRLARKVLLESLTGRIEPLSAGDLTLPIIDLDPSAEERNQAREALIGLFLTSTARPWFVGEIPGVIARLAPTAEEKHQARGKLLRLLLNGQTRIWLVVGELADAVARLEPTAEDKRQARETILRRLLTRRNNSWEAAHLARAAIEFDASAEDKRQAREILLECLACQTEASMAERLADVLALLDPAGSDLNAWRCWAVRPTAELLAAARRKSTLDVWLPALPSLAVLSE